jgi:hypothetical protein
MPRVDTFWQILEHESQEIRLYRSKFDLIREYHIAFLSCVRV